MATTPVAVRVKGKKYLPNQSRIISTVLQGMSQTVANGTKSQVFALRNASNIQYIRDYNRSLNGGSCGAIALGVMFRIRYTVDVNAIVGADPDLRVTKSIHERLALSTVDVKPGKAGQGYNMSRGDTSIGLLMMRLEDAQLCKQTTLAAKAVTAGYAVTADRNGTNSDGMSYGAIDNRPLVATRDLFRDEQRRIVASGTDVTVPEFGDQLEDLFFFPLTADGPFGPHSSGFDMENLFSATNTWEFTIRPVFDTGIYSAGSALVGDFEIDVNLVWRSLVANPLAGSDKKPADPIYGKVWQWNNSVATVADGTLQTLSGPAVNNHVLVGYPSTVYGEAIGNSPVPIVDGTNYFLQDVTGAGDTLKCRIAPINIPPTYFNTQAKYIQIGREGGENTLPRAGYTQAYGREILEAWNWPFQARAIPGKFYGVRGDSYGSFTEGNEFPLFAETGVKSFATSLVSRTDDGTVRYGASWGGGAAVPTIPAPTGSTKVDSGLGGLNHFALAFSPRETNGFAEGIEVRPPGDTAGITVLSFGGFPLPKAYYGATQPANVEVIRILTDYDNFSTDACACNPHTTVPAVINAASPNAALGDALTTAVIAIAPEKPNVTS